MYEHYPYPAGTAQIRVQSDVRLLLSYVTRCRSQQRPLHVLDAGCGRGLGVIGSAMTQPDVRFIGVDMNRVALRHARQSARDRGLENIEFVECDLMTLEGLSVPEGGFDVIYSLGVVHHMSDPGCGLQKLRGVLAPHGVIAFMVYAKYGRAPLIRLRESIDLLFADGEDLAQRIPAGRDLARSARSTILANTYWADTADTHDIEFVDRCLNVNEAAYDIAALWDLLATAGLRFVRWFEPDLWGLEQLPAGDMRDRANRLTDVDRYRLLERITEQNAFELVLAHEDNPARAPISQENVKRLSFALSPDIAIAVETRTVRSGQRTESLSYRLRHRDPVVVSDGPLATALLLLREQIGSFQGTDFVVALLKNGVAQQTAVSVLTELLDREIIYSPHETDL